jgi:RNA polymerase sigma factor (sigma-70 family)
VDIGVDERGAAEDLGASYSSLFRELSSAFRTRGLGPDEASDFAQESLVRTFVHLKRHGRTQPDLRPLAHTIARRLYAERGRRLRPKFVELPEAELLADPTPEPVEQIVASEERADVHAALRSLTPRHRRVVTLWMGGLRPAEIAQELGIKRNAADALLHRARRQLAAKLDPSKTTLGLFGIAMLRIRGLFRRAVDAVASLDPTGSVAQATTGLAVVGLTAALMVAAPTTGGNDRNIGGDRVVVTEVGSAHRSVEPKALATAARIRAPEVAYPYQVGTRMIVRDPATNEEQPYGAGLDYTPEGGIGALDPVVEPAARVACGVTPGSCFEE